MVIREVGNDALCSSVVVLTFLPLFDGLEVGEG